MQFVRINTSLVVAKKIIVALERGQLLYLLNRRLRFVGRINRLATYDQYLHDSNYDKMLRKFSRYLDSPDEICEEEVPNKVIWMCWFQGVDSAPAIVKACYRSVVANSNGARVIMLDKKTLHDYVEIPEYIQNKYEKGMIPHAQFSDYVRISLLKKYGGAWLDCTVFCSQKIPEWLFDESLFVYKYLDLSKSVDAPILASNWLIFAKRNNPIISLTHKLLDEYWREYNRPIDYFIFHIFFAMAARYYPDRWSRVPLFNNASPHVLQFELGDEYNAKRWAQISNMSVFHKLDKKAVFGEGTFYSFIVSGGISPLNFS